MLRFTPDISHHMFYVGDQHLLQKPKTNVSILIRFELRERERVKKFFLQFFSLFFSHQYLHIHLMTRQMRSIFLLL